jgi:hypothetical protein
MHELGRRVELKYVSLFAYELTRESTSSMHLLGLEDYLAYARRYTAFPMPATAEEVAVHIVYSMKKMEPTLASSTLENYLHGLSAFHENLNAAVGGVVANPVISEPANEAVDEGHKPSSWGRTRGGSYRVDML